VTLSYRTQPASFTLRPDGSDLHPMDVTRLSPTTNDPVVPKNGVQLRLVDDPDALQWTYLDDIPQKVRDLAADAGCTNRLKGSANAGYRNQIVARLADGSERQLTRDPTFKYQIVASPDGETIAYTGITVTDYDLASTAQSPFRGYTIDVYVVRLSSGTPI